MYNKKLSKIYAGCALAMALAVTAAPINVFAAEGDPSGEPVPAAHKEVNSLTPGTTEEEKAAKAADPTKLEGIDPTSRGDDPATTDITEEAYADTDIDVWGFTEDGTVYSVDVEWGAMTFEYELSSWDPETHTSTAGRGWLVYDSTQDEVLGDVHNAINRVTVTNHSNAAVYAKLTYAGEKDDANSIDYTATTGTFAATDTANKPDASAPEESGSAFDADKGVITLQTADNNQGEGEGVGKPTVGHVYFMPTGDTDASKEGGIAKWTKIGKITVSLLTEDPTTAGGGGTGGSSEEPTP